jgi:transcriptional regulator with XRE-family HTH domain
MTDRDELSGLRAARLARGWSQAEAARELAGLARTRGAPVASAASLKTLLSRWENGHSVPDPQYRTLLAVLYDRSIAQLALDRSGEGGSELTAALAASLAAAEVQRTGMHRWRQQLALARDLDDELGAAGAGELVNALVERLTDTLLHTVPRAARVELSGLLSESAALAGSQALDRTRHDQAWRRFDLARTAAAEAGRSAGAAVAVAGQAAVLVDIGVPGDAVQLLEETPPIPDGTAQTRLDAALALARAATGEQHASRLAIAAAVRRLLRAGADPVDRSDGPPVRAADLHRWQGRVLVTLGDAGAAEPLRRALASGLPSTRHRAAVHADLAIALHAGRPAEAAQHARTARELAAGIGSARIPARLAELGGPGP